MRCVRKHTGTRAPRCAAVGGVRVLSCADSSGVFCLLVLRKALVVRDLPLLQATCDVSRRDLATLDSTIRTGASMTLAAASGIAAGSMTGRTDDPADDRLDDDGAPPRLTPTATARSAQLKWATSVDDPRADGSWLPRSNDAVSELRDLIPAVSAHLGSRITRVSLNMDAWDGDQPRRLQLPDGIVRLGWFRLLDPGTVTLGQSSGDRIVLRVLPQAVASVPAHRKG